MSNAAQNWTTNVNHQAFWAVKNTKILIKLQLIKTVVHCNHEMKFKKFQELSSIARISFQGQNVDINSYHHTLRNMLHCC